MLTQPHMFQSTAASTDTSRALSTADRSHPSAAWGPRRRRTGSSRPGRLYPAGLPEDRQRPGRREGRRSAWCVSSHPKHPPGARALCWPPLRHWMLAPFCTLEDLVG